MSRSAALPPRHKLKRIGIGAPSSHVGTTGQSRQTKKTGSYGHNLAMFSQQKVGERAAETWLERAANTKMRSNIPGVATCGVIVFMI